MKKWLFLFFILFPALVFAADVAINNQIASTNIATNDVVPYYEVGVGGRITTVENLFNPLEANIVGFTIHADNIASLSSTYQPLDAFLTDIAALTDPGADRITFWDDSAGDIVWLTVGTGLSISGTTITATGLAGDLKSDGTVELSADWDAGSHKITAETLESDVATGTAPFAVASETMVDNLNADMVDGTELAALTTDAELALWAGTANVTTLGTITTGTWNGTPIVGDYININGMGTAETSIAADDLIAIYDTSATAMRKMTRGNFVSGIGAGQAIVLDLADDGSDESTDLGEIAVENDTNSIFSEPSADKLHINCLNNWPTADTANAGDSATAFFSAGTIEHERGGLEADVSGYSGLAGINAGATVEVDTEAELETMLGGANVIVSTEIDTEGEIETLISDAIIVDGEIDTYSELNTIVADATLYASGQTDVAVADGGTGASDAAGAKTNLGFMTDLADDATPSLGGNLAVGANEIQSTGNVVLQLGDNAGSNKFSIQDSDGVEIYSVTSDGAAASVAVNNPYVYFNENDGTDYWLGINDTATDRFEIRRSSTAGTSVDFYADLNGMYSIGNCNIATGHTYQINGTQINIGNLGVGGNWTPTGEINLDSATLTLNSDALTVDDGSNYTTISNSSDDDTIDELFDAINTWAEGVSAGTLVTLSDVGGSDVYTAGYVIVGDGSDSYDPKAISGDISLGSDGAVIIANDAVTMAKLDEDGNFTDWTGNWTFSTGTFRLNHGMDFGGNVVSLNTHDWNLTDNVPSAFSFDTSGATGLLNIVTTDGSEGVTTSGYFTATGAVTAGTMTSSYTIVTPQALSVTADDDVTVGTELTSSVVLCTGDDDSTDETLTLQDGVTAGTILTIVAIDGVDADNDALIIDAETDSTCTGCPDAGIFTFETEGSSVTLYWTGTAWIYRGTVVGE